MKTFTKYGLTQKLTLGTFDLTILFDDSDLTIRHCLLCFFVMINIHVFFIQVSNIKNGLKVKQLAKKPPTLKTLINAKNFGIGL